VRRVNALSLGIACALVACGTEATPPTVFHLDRPSDVGFACLGGLGTPAPLSACAKDIEGKGQLYAFVLQSHTGEALAYKLLADSTEVVDSEPLGPGAVGIPVGKRPVEIGTLADGTQMIVANQGSCDLALIDVAKATQQEPGVVTRREVKTTAGTIAARPTSLVAASTLRGTATTCATPGACPVYVAYPGCHVVVAVDPLDGQVLKGVRFPAGNVAPEIIAATQVSCAAECGALAGNSGPGLSPRVLALDSDDGRLFVGAGDSSSLYVVTLGADDLPSAVDTVALEGAGGLRRISASGDVVSDFGTRRYVYAVGEDQAVHVVDVSLGLAAKECDTQVDPRYLRDRSDAERSCVSIGAFPRRPLARGPAIRLPRDEVPLDVGFLRGDQALKPIKDDSGNLNLERPSPSVLSGAFAVITAESSFGSGLRGRAYFINLWDENYRASLAFDANRGGSLAKKEFLPRLYAHQLRDGVFARDVEPPLCLETYDGAKADQVGPSGLAALPAFSSTAVVNFKGTTGNESFSPMLHREVCTQVLTSADPLVKPTTLYYPVFELSPGAPAAVRDLAVTDMTQVHDEKWTVAWEGRLDTFDDGVVTPEAGGFDLFHPAGAFCEAGLEDGDIVEILGCASDGDCGVSEVCYVHPDAPATGTRGSALGMCFPRDGAAELSAECRDLLVTHRRYTALNVRSDHVVLAPRFDMFAGTPAEGCTDDAQCNALAGTTNAWTCVQDPALGSGKHCVRACTEGAPTLSCDPGSVCAKGLCVEGPLAPALCLAPLQRISLRAGLAYTLSGATPTQASFPSTGALYRRVRNPATGVCEQDLLASPLLVGRFRRDEPTCASTDPRAVDFHNPCAVLLEEPIGGVQTDQALATRTSHGVRVSTPGFTVHIADVLVTHASGAVFSPAPDDYFFSFIVTAGYVPRAEPLAGVLTDDNTSRLVSEGASLPLRVRSSPEGALWIVDVSDGGTSRPRGQVLELPANPSTSLSGSVSRALH
jgi:hypothetical protein